MSLTGTHVQSRHPDRTGEQHGGGFGRYVSSNPVATTVSYATGEGGT